MTGTSGDAPSVFISYSHKDEAWKDRFQTHLSVLKMQEILDIWDDRQIQAGDEWYDEIEGAIDNADVAVFLISAHFLTSPFILDEEVARFLERSKRDGLRIIPIVIRSCSWGYVPWLSAKQLRPKDGRPIAAGDGVGDKVDADFAAIVNEIGQLIKGPRRRKKRSLNEPKIDLTRLPAVGEHLLGREKELAQLDDAWADPSLKTSSAWWLGVGLGSRR